MDYGKSLLLAACLIGAAAGSTKMALADSLTPTTPTAVAPGPSLPAQSQAATGGPAPIILRLQYSGEAADNPIGGLHNGATYLNNVLGQLTVNTASAFGWPGGKFVLQAFYENADSLDTQYVGALQDPSLIDTSGVAMFRVYQAYYQQTFGNTDLLFGIYDPETEFGITRPMDVFFNGAYAWTTTLDQSGVNGPSTYPNTSLGLRIRQKLDSHWSVQAAVLDGIPDSVKYPNINAVNINRTAGALLIGELDYTPTRTTKLMAGYWDYTGKFEALGAAGPDGTQRYVFGSNGGYIGGATRLYSQTARRGLDAFANLGIATAQTQQADRSLNLGVTYTGLLDQRPIDRLGFAVGIVHAGSPYRQMQIASGAGARSYETNFELTYRVPITRWLVIQPDIQYWINPNMDPELKNDLLFLLHFEISHVFD